MEGQKHNQRTQRESIKVEFLTSKDQCLQKPSWKPVCGFIKV